MKRQVLSRFTARRARCADCEWTCPFDGYSREEADLHSVETGHTVIDIREVVTKYVIDFAEGTDG